MGTLEFPTIQRFLRGSSSPFRSKVHRFFVLMLKLPISVVGISFRIPWHVPEGWWMEALVLLVERFLLLVLPGFGEVIPLFILIKT